MKEIELTQGKVALVDDQDYEWLNQWKWFTVQNKDKNNEKTDLWYARRNASKINRGGGPAQIHMHRLIMGLTDSKIDIDHDDHDGLNNQRYNLRLAPRTQNNGNQRPQTRKTSSEYKGVGWFKLREVWRAYIQIEGKFKHIGYFASETDAALAYNTKAIEVFGEFAYLNEISDSDIETA